MINDACSWGSVYPHPILNMIKHGHHALNTSILKHTSIYQTEVCKNDFKLCNLLNQTLPNILGDPRWQIPQHIRGQSDSWDGRHGAQTGIKVWLHDCWVLREWGPCHRPPGTECHRPSCLQRTAVDLSATGSATSCGTAEVLRLANNFVISEDAAGLMKLDELLENCISWGGGGWREISSQKYVW